METKNKMSSLGINALRSAAFNPTFEVNIKSRYWQQQQRRPRHSLLCAADLPLRVGVTARGYKANPESQQL